MLIHKCRILVIVLLTSLVLTACSSRGAQHQKKGPMPSMKSAQMEYDNKNYQVALEQLTLIAIRGNPEAQYAVGYMYYYGQGVDKNTDIARGWFRYAAARGHGKAQEALYSIDDLPMRSSS